MAFHVPRRFRVKTGPLATSHADGNNGAFRVRSLKLDAPMLQCIASDGDGWEHVSVSHHNRCPTWDELEVIKNIFWDADDVVMQLHMPKGEHINNHPYCLHLWRPAGGGIPTPPSWMVGFRELNRAEG